MLAVPDIERVVGEYIERFVPAMLRRGYHLYLVKGGPEYPHLSEQSHFTHIINGVFALTRFLSFSSERGISIPHLDEGALRKALALYTVHEVHKDREVEQGGASEFDIPLGRLREEYTALGMEDFAGAPDDHLLRAANVHKRSPRHGDLLLSGDPDAARLWLLVRIADTLASVVGNGFIADVASQVLGMLASGESVARDGLGTRSSSRMSTPLLTSYRCWKWCA